jgi:hypothetical protein
MNIDDLRKVPEDNLQTKLNRVITNMGRLEIELDGIVGDLERIQRFENLQGDMKHFVDQAHKLTCSATGYLEEARIFISK